LVHEEVIEGEVVEVGHSRREDLLIDGGGMRGIFPLRILKLLSDRVSLPYPVQENFDGASGINSGKLLIATYSTALAALCLQVFKA